MQYKQIGNAVPVNLAEAVGRAVVAALNTIEDNAPPALLSRKGAIVRSGSCVQRIRPASQMLLAVERKKAKMTAKQSDRGFKGKKLSATHRAKKSVTMNPKKVRG